MNTSKELAPEEDQGIVFAMVKAPQYANLDYTDFYGDKLDKAFAAFPETDLPLHRQRHQRPAATASPA